MFFTSAPFIDVSGVRSVDAAERERVAGEIGHAAREVGFLPGFAEAVTKYYDAVLEVGYLPLGAFAVAL